MRIMYVEDNPANLFLVQRVARMGNHEVVSYAEGQAALDHFKDDKPDLVLMDIQLSGVLNGLEVVRALRDAGYKTPIIAVTAYAMSGDREKCLEAGCDGYLAKPLPVGELVELFKRYEVIFKPVQATAVTAFTSDATSTPETTPDSVPEAKKVASEPTPPKTIAEPEVDPTADTIPSRAALRISTEIKPVPASPETSPAPSEGNTTPENPPKPPADAKPEAEAAKPEETPSPVKPTPTSIEPVAPNTTSERQMELPPKPQASTNGTGMKMKAESE